MKHATTFLQTWEKIIFEYKDATLPKLKKCNYVKLTQGLISNTILSKIKQYASGKSFKDIAGKIVHLFHNVFCKYIWKSCCEKMIHAKQEAGITKSIKIISTPTSSTYTDGLNRYMLLQSTINWHETIINCMTRCKNHLTD